MPDVAASSARWLIGQQEAGHPKSLTQLRYVQAIRAATWCSDRPGSTGKTFLAMAMGVALLTQKRSRASF